MSVLDSCSGPKEAAAGGSVTLLPHYSLHSTSVIGARGESAAGADNQGELPEDGT